jgi:hypothetical protein
VLGIGGGGDVVGALSVARLCERMGRSFVLGGVAWERLPIDPNPGPRPMEEIAAARPLSNHVALAGPETRTTAGAVFAESHMARFLGEETVLIDILAGPRAIAESIGSVAELLGADLVIGVDVGGDVLGDGTEAGLASPLCDAVMLAALKHLEQAGHRTLGAVFGPGCDGELTIEEILDRLAMLAAGGGVLGAHGMTPDVVAELEEAVRVVPTEASAQAIRCANGEVGHATIRRGRRQVVLSPIGALTFFFEPQVAIESVARLAQAVMEAGDLEQANDILNGLGVRTELDFERQWTEA